MKPLEMDKDTISNLHPNHAQRKDRKNLKMNKGKIPKINQDQGQKKSNMFSNKIGKMMTMDMKLGNFDDREVIIISYILLMLFRFRFSSPPSEMAIVPA